MIAVHRYVVKLVFAHEIVPLEWLATLVGEGHDRFS
jgi:hypothetical protein